MNRLFGPHADAFSGVICSVCVRESSLLAHLSFLCTAERIGQTRRVLCTPMLYVLQQSVGSFVAHERDSRHIHLSRANCDRMDFFDSTLVYCPHVPSFLVTTITLCWELSNSQLQCSSLLSVVTETVVQHVFNLHTGGCLFPLTLFSA